MPSDPLRPAPAGIRGPQPPDWEPPSVIIDRFMVRVNADLGPPTSWQQWPGEKSHGLAHRYCEHLIDRPLSPIEARRVLAAMQWRLGVGAHEIEDAIWAWENRHCEASAAAVSHRRAVTITSAE